MVPGIGNVAGFFHALWFWSSRIALVLVAALLVVWLFSLTTSSGRARARARLRMWSRLYGQRYWWFQRIRRDEPPFRLYTGRRGRGKTLLATRDLQKELARGSVVFSNYPVADPLSCRTSITFEDIDHLMLSVVEAVLENEALPKEERRRIVLGFDEAQNHFDSRDWEVFPAWLRTFLSESRHYMVGIIACTQSMSQVEKRFRLLCDEVWRVEPVIESWKHKIALFRMQALDEARNSADDDERQVGRARLTWVVGRAFSGYSTVGLPTAEAVSTAEKETMQGLLADLRASVSRPVAVLEEPT